MIILIKILLLDELFIVYILDRVNIFVINKLGIKGRDYVGVAMEVLDKERYFNEAALHLFNYRCYC